MVGTVLTLGFKVYMAGWWSPEALILGVWLGIMGYIVVFRKIGASVAFLKGAVEKVEADQLRLELGRVIGSHHLALLAYLLTAILEVVLIFLP